MCSDEISRSIRASMILADVKPKEMARFCKVSERTWRRWMNNPESITLGYFIAIAARLGTTGAELLEGVGEWI